jgi:hypothetical protein
MKQLLSYLISSVAASADKPFANLVIGSSKAHIGLIALSRYIETLELSLLL